MSEKNIARFLHEYKELVNKLDSAKTQKDLVIILTHSSGMQILPGVLFYQHGCLKTFGTLRRITYQHLDFIIKKNTHNPSISMLLLANCKKSRSMLAKWKFPDTEEKENEKELFVQKFGFQPRNCAEIRSFLLKKNVTDLRLYIDEEYDPHEDLPLLRRLCLVFLTLP